MKVAVCIINFMYMHVHFVLVVKGSQFYMTHLYDTFTKSILLFNTPNILNTCATMAHTSNRMTRVLVCQKWGQ